MLKRSALLIAMLSVFCVTAMLSEGALSEERVVPISQINDTASISSVQGRESIQLREVQCKRENGSRTVALRLLLLFDPRSGVFSWIVADDLSPTDKGVQTSLFKSNRAAFLNDGSLFTFTAEMAPIALRVQESRARASSMDDAEDQALSAVSKLKDPPRDIELARPVRSIHLGRLSKDFVGVPGSEVFASEPRVIDVRWEGQQWTVILKARWTQEIVLDSNFKVISMGKVGN